MWLRTRASVGGGGGPGVSGVDVQRGAKRRLHTCRWDGIKLVSAARSRLKSSSSMRSASSRTKLRQRRSAPAPAPPAPPPLPRHEQAHVIQRKKPCLRKLSHPPWRPHRDVASGSEARLRWAGHPTTARPVCDTRTLSIDTEIPPIRACTWSHSRGSATLRTTSRIWTATSRVGAKTRACARLGSHSPLRSGYKIRA